LFDWVFERVWRMQWMYLCLFVKTKRFWYRWVFE
jgi:hypothetical protein